MIWYIKEPEKNGKNFNCTNNNTFWKSIFNLYMIIIIKIKKTKKLFLLQTLNKLHKSTKNFIYSMLIEAVVLKV